MILVTGGAGYVGSLLVKELLNLGERVRVVDTLWFGNPFDTHENLDLIKADLSCFEPAWLDGVNAMVHLAGLSNDPTADFAPELNTKYNVTATRRFAEAAAEKADREEREMRFLFASTCSVYYTPTTAADWNVQQMIEGFPVAPTANYSKAKRLAEIELLRVAERSPFFCPIIVRKGTIFGLSPRMRFDLVVNTFTLHAWRKRAVTVHGHGEAWRPLLHIRDAVDAYTYLLSAPSETTRGQIFNLTHKNYRVLELAHWVAEVLEQHRGVTIQVKRDRNANRDGRSYYVSGEKMSTTVGFRADRGTTEAILAIWDALERGEFGAEPEKNLSYFNIAYLKETLMQPVAV